MNSVDWPQYRTQFKRKATFLGTVQTKDEPLQNYVHNPSVKNVSDKNKSTSLLCTEGTVTKGQNLSSSRDSRSLDLNDSVGKEVSVQFQCDDCSRQFEHEYLLISHAEIEHNVYERTTKYSSINRNKSFTIEKSWLAFANKLPHKQDLCNDGKFGEQDQCDKARPAVKRMCNICGRLIGDNFALKVHMYSHTGERPLKCGLCDMAFKQSSDLKIHSRIHSGIKPYVCNVCRNTYSTNTYLKYHTRTHTGELPLSCKICGKNFRIPANLNRHGSTHNNDRKVLCKVCTAQFKNKPTLKKHMKIHAEKREHVCKICSKGFNHSYNLRTHMRTHTKERPYKCSICEMSFPHQGTLKKHLERHK